MPDCAEGKLAYLSCDANCLQQASWRVLDLGQPISHGQDGVDLALDGQNRPRIAYRIPSPTDEMAYAWCNSACESAAAGWQTKLVPSTASAQQELPISPRQGCALPQCNPPLPACSSAFWDAGFWPSLALDAQGNPRIAFDIKHHQSGNGCPVDSDARFARFAIFSQPPG